MKRFLRNGFILVFSNTTIYLLALFFVILPIAAITGRDVFGMGTGMVIVTCYFPAFILFIVSLVKEGLVPQIMKSVAGIIGVFILLGSCVFAASIGSPITLLFVGAPGSGTAAINILAGGVMGFVAAVWIIFHTIKRQWAELVGIVLGYAWINVFIASIRFLIFA